MHLIAFFWYFLFGFDSSRCNKLECRGVNSRQIRLGLVPPTIANMERVAPVKFEALEL